MGRNRQKKKISLCCVLVTNDQGISLRQYYEIRVLSLLITLTTTTSVDFDVSCRLHIEQTVTSWGSFRY